MRDMASPQQLIETALRAADAAARELLMRADRPSSGVITKSTDTDMVSDADRAAEVAILEVLDAERPRDGRLAEEGGARAGTSGLWWVIDPLDGTTNYLWGIPHWAVSIAVCDDDGPVAGVVMHPTSRETFVALRGGGAWLGTQRLEISAPPVLGHALVGTGFNYSAAERQRQANVLVRVLPVVRDVRRFGAAALDLSWVAAGRLDAFIERGVQEWDWMAGRLLVTEAGGAITLLGATAERPAGIAAAHPELLEAIVALFEGTDTLSR
jgi:myo-inositol-1(or 4)-monophosphatase